MKSGHVGELGWSSSEGNMFCLNKLVQLCLLLLLASVPVPTLAWPPETKPTPAVCKADLKEWSVQRTETAHP